MRSAEPDDDDEFGEDSDDDDVGLGSAAGEDDTDEFGEDDDAASDGDADDDDDADDADDEMFDGDVDGEMAVSCPYCGETSQISLDYGSGPTQEYIEDCEVCCRPWRVRVRYDRSGAADVTIDPA